MATVTIGVDIGQKQDPTAVAVVESEWRKVGQTSRNEDHYLVRHLERLALGTPYPAVAKRLQAIVEGVRTRGHGMVVYVDATGVGQPVVDLLQSTGMTPHPVYFTHGDRRVVETDKTIKLGKAWLVSRLQALLQTGRIHLPKTHESEALARELQDYEIRVDERANDTYGAFKVGAHDDLVTALGLAVQECRALDLAGMTTFGERRYLQEFQAWREGSEDDA